MNLDETQALELGQDSEEEEEQKEKNRKLVSKSVLLITYCFTLGKQPGNRWPSDRVADEMRI